MSRQVDEKKYRLSDTKSKDGLQKTRKRFASFHPTKEQKEFLRGQEDALEDLLIGLSSHLQKGCKVTLGHSEYNNAYYCSIRENTANWQDARAVSAWHVEPDMALRTLCYALQVKFTSFPDLGEGWTEEDLNW
jgi:hypothetical protein